MRMTFVLGIDQGASKTQAIVTNSDGRILGTGSSFGACHSSDGMEAAMEAVQEASQQALDAAGLSASQVTRIAAGMTGVDWPHEAPLLHQALCKLFIAAPEKVTVVNDCLIALRAGTSRPSGVILCAGTGLNCAVRHSDGREFTFGFYIADDCQGGTALGYRVLQAVFDAACGMRGETSLTQPVLVHFGCDTVDHLLHRHVTAHLPKPLIRQLPLLLEEAALAGDAVSCALLDAFGRDIAQYVVAGLRRFDMLGEETEVMLSGSVFKCRAPQLTAAVQEVILSSAPHAVIRQSIYEPVIGAALLALDSLENMNASLIARNIAQDAQTYHLLRKQDTKG